MEQVLIVGVDTVVGANLAATLADRFRVAGISVETPVSIDGCEMAIASADDSHTIRNCATLYHPQRLLLCGTAGDSAWHECDRDQCDEAALASTTSWARAAREWGAALTLISSDAIFTGPWMFHGEASTRHCDSAEARALRKLEEATLEECPNALVVRTHAYGWSPLTDRLGWIEGILAALESDSPGIFDCVPHATPILATDLAEVVQRAWDAELSGIYHIAGAERTSPHQFVRSLASIFELAPPQAANLGPSDAPRAAFAQGETSLLTQKIRRALDVSMPMLAEGLQRLREQQNNGFDRRLRPSFRPVASKVA